MKAVGLFAGIGGMELALRKEGFESELLCEILPEAQRVLRKRFSAAQVVGDIRKLRSLPSGTSIVCAGFPCQDLSSSGLKGGINGLRSSLVSEVFRLIRKNRPAWILLENVKFMLHLGKGEAMRVITHELETLGYRWAYRVLNSQDFGVPQRRERVFVLASLAGDPETVLFRQPSHKYEPPARPEDISRPVGFYWTEGTHASGLASDALPPLKGGSTIGIPSPPAALFPSGIVGTPDLRDAERLQGFDEDWTAPAEEIAKASTRWKLVGNAVTVDVVRWIAKGIKSSPPSSPPTAVPHTEQRWPNAAFGGRGARWRVEEAFGPSDRVLLSRFLNHPLKPLSKKAVTGFIGRAKKGSLFYPKGFISALEKYAKLQ